MIPEVLSLLNKGVENTIFLVVLAFKVFSLFPPNQRPLIN